MECSCYSNIISSCMFASGMLKLSHLNKGILLLIMRNTCAPTAAVKLLIKEQFEIIVGEKSDRL